MPHPTVRMFETEEQARSAYQQLLDEGFPASGTFIVTPGGEGGQAGALSEAVKAGRLLGERAAFYAERVRAGRSLVGTMAPFGYSQLAGEIMERAGAVDLDLRVPSLPQVYGEGAPFSQFLLVPPLSTGGGAPLSNALGLPVLTRGRSRTRVGNWITPLGKIFPALTSSRFFPGAFLPLLSGVRQFVPLPTKAGRSGDSWRMSLGLPLLSRNNPAPFSTLFGLPLLLEER